MRIQRLDLVRYGHFTEQVLNLPNKDSDMHIVYGANEAGKSTILSGIECLLFGIPKYSTFDFLHDYNSMRIGGLLEANGNSLEIRRRKGTRGTLLAMDDTPHPKGDRALDLFLANTRQEFFRRMFCLNNSQLREGGEAILNARDEVGQVLFSAGAGIEGLHTHLKQLKEEAEALWGPRRSQKKKYYQVSTLLKDAEKTIREHSIHADAWARLKSDSQDAQQAMDVLDHQIQEKDSEFRRLTRIRGINRPVKEHEQLETSLSDLGTVAKLPADAEELLSQSEQIQSNAERILNELRQEIADVRNKLTTLSCDEILLQRKEDIVQLNEQRIGIRSEKSDLPKRRAELELLERKLLDLANELELESRDIDQLAKSVPSRPVIVQARKLLSNRRGVHAEINAAMAAYLEAEENHQKINKQFDEFGTLISTQQLSNLISVTKSEHGDIAVRIHSENRILDDTKEDTEHWLSLLKPAIKDDKVAVSVDVPTHSEVQIHRDFSRESQQKIKACQQKIRIAKQDIANKKSSQQLLDPEHKLVHQKDVKKLREHRDTGWTLIRKKYIDCSDVSNSGLSSFQGEHSDLAEAYEKAVSQTDQAADQMFENAEKIAAFAASEREIVTQQAELKALIQKQENLEEEHRSLDADWKQLWAGAPFEPHSPDAMLKWLETREKLLDCVKRRMRSARHVSNLRQQETAAIARITQHLNKLIPEPELRGEHSLSYVLETASSVLNNLEKKASSYGNLASALQSAKSNAESKRNALESARNQLSEWEAEWAEFIPKLGLDRKDILEIAEPQFDLVDEMRECSREITELRKDRIKKIERDLEAYRIAVKEVVETVASDLSDKETDQAVTELNLRSMKAQEIKKNQESLNDRIKQIERKIERNTKEFRSAQEQITQLQEWANVKNIEDLKKEIEKASNAQVLSSKLTQKLEIIEHDGEGRPIQELRKECNSVDADQLPAQISSLEDELKYLREQANKARDKRNETITKFENVGGQDTVVNATADRQNALADMQQIAEQYVRVRTATFLLQWGINQFWQQKQGPLLKNASKLFKHLTRDSFLDLSLDMDERDKMRLVACRPDQTRLGVEAMSDGTVDQLYLALRVAAIEDYLGRKQPAMPFIADDLFINFDDDRAAAGLQILGRLSEKCQVIFFTHHEHLVRIARECLPQDTSIQTVQSMH